MASYSLSVMTVGIDPTIELGPVTLAWHWLTIASGILVGSLLAARAARERGFPPVPLWRADPPAGRGSQRAAGKPAAARK